MPHPALIPPDPAELRRAYAALGVARGETVLHTGNLAGLMQADPADRRAVLRLHHEALSELLGPEGTLVVPTASASLCNTETPYDPARTRSEMGAFTEYVRRLPGAVRSFHPFVSYTAIGPAAEAVCGNVSRHAYGPETPEARLIERGALSVSVAMHPRLTCSVVHHIEMAMGVPYRYPKEYIHPVVRGGAVLREPFYQYVWYRECGIERDMNVRLFAGFEAKHRVLKADVGRGALFSYRIAEFYRHAVGMFRDDIYAWLRRPPAVRPYQR